MFIKSQFKVGHAENFKFTQMRRRRRRKRKKNVGGFGKIRNSTEISYFPWHTQKKKSK